MSMGECKISEWLGEKRENTTLSHSPLKQFVNFSKKHKINQIIQFEQWKQKRSSKCYWTKK